MKTRTKREKYPCEYPPRVDHGSVEQEIKNCGLQADDLYER